MRIAISLALALAGWAAMAHGPGHGGRAGHGAVTFSAGEPGDPKTASRVVEITMRETDDGRMLFAPTTLSFKTGEQVRFVLRNVGQVEHEFVVDSPDGIVAHRAEMAANPAMAHTDANALHVDPAKRGELVWRFTKAGSFEFACMLPGHYEAGMKGTVTVK